MSIVRIDREVSRKGATPISGNLTYSSLMSHEDD